jgi:hypothetical protein
LHPPLSEFAFVSLATPRKARTGSKPMTPVSLFFISPQRRYSANVPSAKLGKVTFSLVLQARGRCHVALRAIRIKFADGHRLPCSHGSQVASTTIRTQIVHPKYRNQRIATPPDTP